MPLALLIGVAGAVHVPVTGEMGPSLANGGERRLSLISTCDGAGVLYRGRTVTVDGDRSCFIGTAPCNERVTSMAESLCVA